MNITKTILILAFAALAPALFASTSVENDITTDTTWNNAGSPYILKPDPNPLKVKNGATLTIDSSGGNVEIQYASDGTDFQIGNGSGDEGYLHLKAASGTIKFRLRASCNLVINAYGQVVTTDSTAITYFENYDPGKEGKGQYDWGAIDFEASQTFQSNLVNIDVTGGGYDGKDGALVVRDNEAYPPLLEDLTFDDCNTSAIRFDGKGINTLRQDGLKLPLSVTNTDYVFYLVTVTSTESIRFPDTDTPSAPEAKLTGTATVGSGSDASHWRFDDGYIFDCAASSKVDVVHGSVWGNEESRPVFQSISGTPGFTDWNGIWDTNTTYNNVFEAGMGGVGQVTVKDATFGVKIDKGSSGTILDGKTYRISGIIAEHCDKGIYLQTPNASTGGVLIAKDCIVGGTLSTNKCNTGIYVNHGNDIQIQNSSVLGVGTDNWAVEFRGYGSFSMSESRMSGTGTGGVYFYTDSPKTGTDDASLTIDRTTVNGDYSTGVNATASPPREGESTITKSLQVKHSCLQGSIEGLFVSADMSSATLDVELEDCTFPDGGTYGMRGYNMDTSDSFTATSCTFSGYTYGAYFTDLSANSLDYQFESCVFVDNTNGLYDARDNLSAARRVTAVHCHFINNSTYGAFDAADNFTFNDKMLAEYCFWNDFDGPGGSGPGAGDPVNANVDWGSTDDFYKRPYLGRLIGGSPAGASEWDVWENATTNGDNLHIIDITPYFKWTFASDFEGDTQASYQIQVDDEPDFSSTPSLPWDTAKTAHTTLDKLEYAGTTLAAETMYYARIRLWNADDLPGPWSYLTFRLNSAPPQVSSVANRLPDNAVAHNDSTPVFQFECPTDVDEDSLHFTIELDDNSSFNNGGGLLQTFSSTTSLSWFEFSTDSGTTWVPFPADGCPTGNSFLVRCNFAGTALGDDTWYWRVRASDGFEDGSWATTWSFPLTRSYTISGQLTDNTGTGLNSRAVRLYINGEDSGDIVDTQTVSMVDGRFDIVTTEVLEVGDVLWVYPDGQTEKCAAVFHFTGNSITFDDDEEDIIAMDDRLHVYGTIDDLVFSNSDFEITDADTDIPWTYSGGNVTFKSDLNGTGHGVHLFGRWDMSGVLDGTTSLNVELHIGVILAKSGRLRTQGHNASFHALDNEGVLKILDGSIFEFDGADSTTSGLMVIEGSNFVFSSASASALKLTVDGGMLDVRNNATLEDDVGSTSSLVVDAALASVPAILNCVDTTFIAVGVVFEVDGVLGQFNNNIFDSTLSTQHIHWKSTEATSAKQMRGIQFDYALVGSQYNVTATSGANNINMIGCGGVSHGEDKDSDAGNKVDWELGNPTGLNVTLGDTRNHLEWDDDDQIDLATTGYNVYRSTTGVYPFTKINGTPLVTTNSYNDESLSNGTKYYYYVTVALNETPAAGEESASSNQATGTPAESSIAAISPEDTDSTSVLALTVMGTATHWEGSTTVTITKGGGSGVTVNDTTVISPYLILVDATMSAATTGSWTVETTENDIWTLIAYDEQVSDTVTINANDGDVEDRPTLAFTTNNSGVAADANTSGSFVFNIDFTDNNNGIDTTNLEIYASRDVTLASANKTAGTELIGAGLSIDSLDDTDGTCTINQTAGTELFADGEYTLTARVQDDEGNWSEWASIRFYVEGAASDVAIVADSGGDAVFLLQGTTQTITVTGTSLSSTQTIDFGTGVTVDSASGSGSSITITLTTDNTADCGPRTFTTNNGSITGLATVQYPTNVLPTVTNAEPSRNPGIAGINVFLANGAFFKSETDIATRGRMMGMSWGRFYRSDISYNGPLGHNWVGHYFQRAIIDSATDDIWWYTDDGRKEVFTESLGTYSNPDGVYITATSETTHNTITLTDRHGFKCIFNKDGRLSKCVDRNGNESFCTYNYAGQLTTITDDRAKTWDVEYYSHGRVKKVLDKVWDATTPREIEYTFDSNGDLTEQKAPETARYDDAGSNRTTYGYRYDDEHKLTACINPREFEESSNPVAYMENFYDDQDRVIDQRLGSEADVQDTHITKSAFIRLRYESSTLIREIDRAGHRTDYTIDTDKRITDLKRFTAFWSVDTDEPIVHSTKTEVLAKLRSTDPTSFDTTMTYNTNHEVLTVLYPRGNKVAYTYASSPDMAEGNLLTITRSDEGLGSLSDIVTTYTYESNYQFIKTMTDPRSEVYTYTYDYEDTSVNAGNLVKTTSPDIDAGQTATQVITSRTTYNEYGQPVTSTDGEGNVTRLIYYDTGDSDGFVYQSIRAYGELDLTSEYEYDKVGNVTASYSPRAFEAGATKNDYKSEFETNELNQSWHGTRKYEVGDQGSSSLVDVDSYSYFDLNGNRTQSFREYITDAGTAPTAPSDEDDPTTFTKSASAMAATWVESSAKYNLLNYGHESTVDAIAGSTMTRYTSRSEFDSNYNRIASISPLGNRSRVVLDERDYTYKSVSGANSDVQGTFEVDYDSNGNASRSRDALSNESSLVYDGFDRVTKITDPVGHYGETDYDANSNSTETRAYDSLGTLLAQSQTTYDEINRGYTSRSLANDHLGNAIGDGWNTRVSVLDKNSRTITSTNDNGVTHSIFYDGANRTTFSRDALGNEAYMTYNAHSAVTRVDYREINGLNGVTEISHTENILNRSDVAWEQRDRRWGTSLDTSGYSKRDGWGRVTEAVDAEDNSTTVNYDLLSRTTDTIREAGTEDIYTNMYYDDDSRTIQRAIKRNPIDSLYQETDYSYDERNRLITLRRPDGDIWTFNFDENSNRIGWTDPLGTAVTDTFDSRNLVEYRNIELGTGIVGTDYESYEFDGLGRLTASSNYADGDLISASAWAYNTQSAPERHDQTVADYEGSILGTWTTKSEYDESGFNTATIYSDGRTVRHSKDQLDRLLTSYDETNNVDIANYLYRGPRAVVERTFGNGTRTSFTYEASGCGCGGSTGYIENVEHKEISNDRILWATERRYDKRGLVTVERRTQEANYGEVHRFDEAGRLIKTFFGADISGTLIDNYDNKGGTDTDPTIYGLRRDWDLDPRGNRTTVKDYDDALTPVEVYDYSYTENEDTNEYTSIDGNSYSYDEIEQLTDDPTRNLDFEYDYKGQVITEDRDADVTSIPEKRYSYDNQGRRRVETSLYEASQHVATTVVSTFLPQSCTTCSGNAGPQTLEEHTYAGDGDLAFSAYYLFGPGSTGGLSGGSQHPATVASVRGGHYHGNNRILEFIDPATGDDKYRYRYEDQLSSLIGMGDEDGTKLLDYVYLDYGRPIERQIAFDGDHDDVDEDNTNYDSMTEETTIRISDAVFVVDEFLGMQLAVMDTANGGVYLKTVLSNTLTDIVVGDLEQNIITGIKTNDLDFVIYDLVDTNVATSGAYHTAGIWNGAPSYAGSGSTGRTTLTDTGADFQSYMVGWMISLTAEEFSYVEITDYISATQIKVKGDARGLADDEGRYWVIAPPHVDPATSAMRGSYSGGTFEPECHTNYLWANYRYIPPMVGFYVDPDGAPELGVYGCQTGSNQAGWYYAWNRTYDSSTGRWTTPDPAADPYWNLQDYVGSDPLGSSDPSGLLPDVNGYKVGATRTVREYEEWIGSNARGEIIRQMDTELETTPLKFVGDGVGICAKTQKCYRFDEYELKYRKVQMLGRRHFRRNYSVTYTVTDIATLVEQSKAAKAGMMKRYEAAAAAVSGPSTSSTPLGAIYELGAAVDALKKAIVILHEAEALERAGVKKKWVETKVVKHLEAKFTHWDLAVRRTGWKKGKLYLKLPDENGKDCPINKKACKGAGTYHFNRLVDESSGKPVDATDGTAVFDGPIVWTKTSTHSHPSFDAKK